MPVSDCETESIDEAHICPGLDICCKQKKVIETCASRGGTLCGIDKQCLGVSVDASDSTSLVQCCSLQCTEPTTNEETNECEAKGYTCQSSCDVTTQEEASYSCSLYSDFCCKEISGGNGGGAGGEEKKGTKWWLIILIVLVLGAVLFLLRGKLGKGGAPRKPRMPPGAGPSTMMRPPTFPRPVPISAGPRNLSPPMIPKGSIRPVGIQRPQITARPSLKKTETDKELDETLKKLEDMSK